MLVTKADGTTEDFKPEKLRRSLRRAGAHKHEIDEIVSVIESTLSDGVKTQVIYRKAFELLRKSEKPIAAKYSLRRALFGLGPTGFPFEDFLARIFQAEGYTTQTRMEMAGKCATHEVDVVAYKPDHCFIAEAKFHMRPGIKSDLKDALYSYARYLDLKNHHVNSKDTCGIVDLYLITNTKFTKSAVKYANCTGIQLLSWNYPKDNNLQQLVERAGVYPITALTTLPTGVKTQLLQRNIILCREILERPDVLNSVGLAHGKRERVLLEARALLGK